jgi:tetratricopeptide (TPR) repeat protein
MAGVGLANRRLDVALPLAQLYIREARSSGDLRFLGYAEATLGPWVGAMSHSPDALVLQATVLQSRHDFSAALSVLDRALTMRPGDAQALITSATVLRVLGRYRESLSACHALSLRADAAVVALCEQGVRGLTGDLPAAYETIRQISSQGMPPEERAWRDSELGEMAVRLGRDDEAEHWFKNAILFSPDDFYSRGAYADLLLREGRSREVLALLRGRESQEPLLLRIAIAQKALGDPNLATSRMRLRAAFAAEEQRGDGVHRREQSRFLLEVEEDPSAAVRVALSNWQVQKEVEDVLVLARSARAVGLPQAAAPALDFVRQWGLQDVRLTSVPEKRS